MNTFKQLYDHIMSDEFNCPGEHRIDGGNGDENDLLDDALTEEESEIARNSSFYPLRKHAPQLAAKIDEIIKTGWVEKGACDKKIIVELEYDGDGYEMFSYPTASGDCAKAFRLDEVEVDDYSHPIFAAFFERNSLRKIIIPTNTGTEIFNHLSKANDNELKRMYNIMKIFDDVLWDSVI